MATLDFASIVEAIDSFTAEERRRLRDMLNAPSLPPPDCRKQEELARLLLSDGVISRIPPPITGPAPCEEWEPIRIEGKPLSETIIEERR